MKYGQSVTDACIDWATTVKVLDGLREGVRARRKLVPTSGQQLSEGLSRVMGNGLQNGREQAEKVFNDLSSLKFGREGSNGTA